MTFFTEHKKLRQAKALLRDDFSSKKIQLARKMANDGASTAQIRAALGWNVTLATTRNRLANFLIKPFTKNNVAHRGENTALPPLELRNLERTIAVNFKP